MSDPEKFLQRLQGGSWYAHIEMRWFAMWRGWEKRVARVQHWWQRATRGHSNLDWYNYATENSRRATVLLRKLLESEQLGCPGNFPCTAPPGLGRCGAPHFDCWTCPCKPFERWAAMLEDMIFYHEVVAGIYEEPYLDPQTGVVSGSWSPDHLVMVIDPQARQRARRGRYYYFRYYEALWD